MACTFPQDTFDRNQSLKMTASKSGDRWYIYAKNQSRNIIQIRRILLGIRNSSGNWSSILYLRPDGPIQMRGNGKIEQGVTSLVYTLTNTSSTGVQMAAEYTEINQRSVSCQYTS